MVGLLAQPPGRTSQNGQGALGWNNAGLFAKGKDGGNRVRAQTASAWRTMLRPSADGVGNWEGASCRDPVRWWLVINAEAHTAQKASGNKHALINTGTS